MKLFFLLFFIYSCASHNVSSICKGKIQSVEFKGENLCLDSSFLDTITSLEKKLNQLDKSFNPKNDMSLKIIIEQNLAGQYYSYFIKKEKTIVLGVYEDSWKNLSEEVFIHEATHFYLDNAEGYDFLNNNIYFKESIPDLMVDLISPIREKVGSCEELYHRRYIPNLSLSKDLEKLKVEYYIEQANSCCNESYFMYGREKYFCEYVVYRQEMIGSNKKITNSKSAHYVGLVLRDFIKEWHRGSPNLINNFLLFTRNKKNDNFYEVLLEFNQTLSDPELFTSLAKKYDLDLLISSPQKNK